MQHKLLLFLSILLSPYLVQSQTDQSNFVIRIASASGTREILRTLNEEDCGFGPAEFGGSVTKEISGELTWVYDNVGNDSLACDEITRPYAGKVALIRRGGCQFGVKAYRAFKAGAVAIIIVNDNRTDNRDCTAFPIATDDGGLGSEVTVPIVFMARAIANDFDKRLKAKETITVTFSLLRFHSAYSALAYATPISQNDTLFNNFVHYVNISNMPQTDVVVKADLIAPDRTVTSVSRTLGIVLAGKDTMVMLPIKPKDLLGTHTMLFSNSIYKEKRDTLRRQFRLTPYTFALDNGRIEPGGIRASDDFFAINQLRNKVGSLYITGDKIATPTHTTFGIANAAEVYEADPAAQAANEIKIFLYDADRNNDGSLDIQSSFDELHNPLAAATYRITGKEMPDTLFSVRLTSTTGTKTQLKTNHPYILVYERDAALSSTLHDVAYSYTLEAYDPGVFITPVQYGDRLFSGWGSNIIPIQRLELEGFAPTVAVKSLPQLDATKYVVTPNPASDVCHVSLNLQERQMVQAELFDQKGCLLRCEKYPSMQSGQLTLAVSDLPTGVYTLRLQTAKEGAAVQTLSIVR